MGLYIVGLAIVLGFAALLWRQYKSGAGWQRHEASFFVDLIAMGVTALLVGTLALVQLQSEPSAVAVESGESAAATPTQRATVRATREPAASTPITDSLETPTVEATVEVTGTAEISGTATITETSAIEATPSLTTTAEATATMEQYTIAQGDTMIDIAAKFDVSIEEIEAANPGLDVDSLQIDQVINIPRPAPSGAATPTATPAPATPTAAPAAPTAAPTSAPTRGTVRYTVQQGDTLSGIAKRFGVTSEQIIAATPGLNPDRLSIGQVLNIPNQLLP